MALIEGGADCRCSFANTCAAYVVGGAEIAVIARQRVVGVRAGTCYARVGRADVVVVAISSRSALIARFSGLIAEWFRCTDARIARVCAAASVGTGFGAVAEITIIAGRRVGGMPTDVYIGNFGWITGVGRADIAVVAIGVNRALCSHALL